MAKKITRLGDPANPYSEAEKKKRGTETVDFMARRDAAKVNAKAAAAKKTPARKK